MQPVTVTAEALEAVQLIALASAPVEVVVHETHAVVPNKTN
jgi:hypothetical protein